MNPERRFYFIDEIPSIEVLIEEAERLCQINIDIRTDHPKYDLAEIDQTFSSISNSGLTFFLSYKPGIEIRVFLSKLSRSCSVFIRNKDVTYLEGVLCLSILNLGGWIGRKIPHKTDFSKDFKETLPDWVYLPFEVAKGYNGFRP